MLPKLAGFLLLFVAGCATVDDVRQPTVSLVDLAIGRPGLLNQELVLTLRVGNPNDFAIPLEGLALTLEVNGRDLAEGLSDEQVSLPRLGYAEVTVQATASTLSILRELISLGEKEQIDYRISGTAYVGTPFGRRAVPYERNGALSILPPRRDRPDRPPRERERGPKIFRTI